MNKGFDIFDHLPRDCWLNIDMGQLRENIRCLQNVVSKPVLAAVKGNAYGHGYYHAAKAFAEAGARYLGTANYAESFLIKETGLETPILCLGGMLPNEMVLCAQAGIEFFVYRSDHIAALRDVPKSSRPIRVHLKVDTGMGRIGCLPEDAPGIASALHAIKGIKMVGLATHFATASKPDNEHTHGQIDKFNQTISALAEIGIRPEIIHASNSSGSLYHPKARYDMVRFGIGAYGIKPSAVEGCELPNGVNTALTWYARITSSKVLPANSSVSYGAECILSQSTRVGVVPVGYVDGYRRMPKNINTILLNGKERKVLGRINMDQCMIDLGDMPDMTGAEVVLLGQQGDQKISAYDLADRWNTNVYSVYSNIAPRVPRRRVEK